MIKLIDILKEVTGNSEIPQQAYTGKVYSNNSNVWTHGTNRDETIKAIKDKGEFFGLNETPDTFQYEINKGVSGNKQNSNAPNFLKGALFQGIENVKYLITFEAKQKYPGDSFESNNWKEVDYSLIPNRFRANKTSFNKSDKIGVIKPEFRDIKNFRFYRLNSEDKKFYEFDIDKVKF